MGSMGEGLGEEETSQRRGDEECKPRVRRVSARVSGRGRPAGEGGNVKGSYGNAGPCRLPNILHSYSQFTRGMARQEVFAVLYKMLLAGGGPASTRNTEL